jgi:hypothetical protein
MKCMTVTAPAGLERVIQMSVCHKVTAARSIFLVLVSRSMDLMNRTSARFHGANLRRHLASTSPADTDGGNASPFSVLSFSSAES